jgi:hypothetical protein
LLYNFKLEDTLTTLLLCIGILAVEGDEHKHQVGLVFISGFVRELLSNTTSSAEFWSVMLGYWCVKTSNN